MARKRRGPTLLELIREPPPGGSFRMGSAPPSASNGDGHRASSYASRPSSSVGAPPGGSGGGLSWWQMGARTLRIPVGYVIVAGGLALALAVLAYMIGFKRAEAKAEADRARAVQEQLEVVDPLTAPVVGGSTGAPTGGTGSPSGGQRLATRPPASPQGPSASPAGDKAGSSTQTAPSLNTTPGLERDPRVPGLNYWVVARLGPDEARKAAAYLQASGVNVAVIETGSSKFREVIAADGFEGSGSGPEAARIKSRILELGRLYRVQEKGPTDFSDMYARKFSGR